MWQCSALSNNLRGQPLCPSIGVCGNRLTCVMATKAGESLLARPTSTSCTGLCSVVLVRNASAIFQLAGMVLLASPSSRGASSVGAFFFLTCRASRCAKASVLTSFHRSASSGGMFSASSSAAKVVLSAQAKALALSACLPSMRVPHACPLPTHLWPSVAMPGPT